MSNQAPTNPQAPTGPTRVHLVLTKVDPWSVMKMAFLLSVAIGIGLIVASALVWYMLDALEVFAQIRDMLTAVGADSMLKLLAYTEFNRVIAISTFVAFVDIVLMTTLATLGAFLYNLSTALVGGVHVTLSDE